MQFWAKSSHFSPKIAPKPGQNAQTKANGCYTTPAASLHRVKEPSSALQLHDMSEKRPKKAPKAPKSAQCAPTPPNQARAVSWATWLKSEFPGHVVHLQPPIFCGFHPSEAPNEPPRPPYQWSLGGAGGQPSPRTAEASGGSTGVPGAKKNHFFQRRSQTTWDAQTGVFRPF